MKLIFFGLFIVLLLNAKTLISYGLMGSVVTLIILVLIIRMIFSGFRRSDARKYYDDYFK